MKIFHPLRKKPKLVVALCGLAVLSLFTAAYRKTHPVSYHSGAELDEYRSLLAGDLPVGTNDMFIGSGKCAGCHGVDPNGIANLTSEGENVSPAENWRATMMANSSKDPLWRAKVAHETTLNPSHAAELVNTCTRCHAPLGRFEAEHDGIENFTMAMLDADSLANDGVSCMACHSQQIETTGTLFSGMLHYNADTVWGPQFNIPDDDFPLFSSAMVSFVGVEPVPNTKFSQSETCAGCHTLITASVDNEGEPTGVNFIEQATYHEWLNSSFNMDEQLNKECQGCHMPRTEEPIVVASGYLFLQDNPREPYGQHWFAGGNSFMLELMRNRIGELGLTATEEHFNTVIDRTLNTLQHETADIEVIQEDIDGDTAEYTVKITNKAGHKFPSGYPSRRAYIEFIMTDEDGNEVFHSGKLMPGYEVQGQDPEWEPHYNLINDEEQVQIYEMVMADQEGNVTTVLERADHLLKDNRFVPLGFTVDHPAYDSTMIVGTAATDPDFNHVNGVEGSGTDEVHYHIPVSGVNGLVTVTARLMYQSVPPKWLNEMFSIDDPVINDFEAMYNEEGADPVLVATDGTTSLLVNTLEYSKFFSVSPNPTHTGQVTVDAGRDQITRISIYSIDGKLVETLQPNSTRHQFFLPKAVGTYILDVTTSRGRRIEKILRR
jgi:hypothetical protein